MLTEKTGIKRIQKLYLQMLFHCNFNCLHCFQGEKLKRSDRFSVDEIKRVIMMFATQYGLKSVTLLGGEPFIHPGLESVLSFCKDSKLETEVCTNGYRIQPILRRVAPLLDHLRVSIDGLEQTHDTIRRKGSFAAALQTLRTAKSLGVFSSVTTTVTSINVGEIYQLAATVKAAGVSVMKLHQLRLVGNANQHPDLLCDDVLLQTLSSQVQRIHDELQMAILLDDDLDSGDCIISPDQQVETFELERIEVQPDGAMYVSCKAVGSDSNAFWYDKPSGEIVYQPTAHDEISRGAPQVQYVKV